MRKKLRIGGLITAATAFGILAYYAHQIPYFQLDLTISRAMQELNGGLPGFMYGVSLVSSRIPAIIIVVAIAVWLGRRGHRLKAILAGVIPGVMALAIVPLLKSQVGRPRPTPELIRIISQDNTNSFPSGHATFVTVFYGFIFYLLPHLTANRKIIITGRILLGVLIGLTYASRIYLGAHWASDVLGGFLIGGVALITAIIIYCYYLPRFSERGQDAGTA